MYPKREKNVSLNYIPDTVQCANTQETYMKDRSNYAEVFFFLQLPAIAKTMNSLTNSLLLKKVHTYNLFDFLLASYHKTVQQKYLLTKFHLVCFVQVTVKRPQNSLNSLKKYFIVFIKRQSEQNTATISFHCNFALSFDASKSNDLGQLILSS